MPQQFMIQGRVVFGHPSKPREKKDVRTRQPIIKDGQKVMQYVFGVAIEKSAFNASVWPMLQKEAAGAFPNGIPQNFSWKFKDGDSIDSKGQPYGKREGYAGHCVMTISTEGFAPQCFKSVNGQYQQALPEEIKCGDYVAVNVTIKYNGAVSPNTPGLYVNPNGVVHIGYGAEIASAGQDPDEMFAGFNPAMLPAGASATPVMPHAAMPGVMQPGAAPAPGYAPQAPAPAYGAPPAAMPYAAAPAASPYVPPAAPALPAPAHDFVHNAVNGGVPPAPAMPAPFPPPGWTAHPAAPGHYYMGQEVLNEAQLRARVTAPAAPAMPGYPGQPAGR